MCTVSAKGKLFRSTLGVMHKKGALFLVISPIKQANPPLRNTIKKRRKNEILRDFA